MYYLWFILDVTPCEEVLKVIKCVYNVTSLWFCLMTSGWWKGTFLKAWTTLSEDYPNRQVFRYDHATENKSYLQYIWINMNQYDSHNKNQINNQNITINGTFSCHAHHWHLTLVSPKTYQFPPCCSFLNTHLWIQASRYMPFRSFVSRLVPAEVLKCIK